MLKQQVRHRVLCSALVLAVGSTCWPALASDPSPNMKYEVPMPRDAFFSPLGTKTEAENNQLQHMLMDPVTMFDPQKRQALLVTARPILLQFRADFQQLAATYPSMQKAAAIISTQTTQRLALLGDEDTNKQLQTDAAGSDVSKAIAAQGILIDNEWTLADGNVAKERELVDRVEKLDHAHPENEGLTNLSLKLSSGDVVPELHDRLLDLAIGMNNPTAKKLQNLKRIRDASKVTKALVGQPFVLTGKTPEGKDFTTADWKGKVILVDFWATWCPPCKAELPHIQALYAKDHDKGFEIVSVSNDFDLKALQTYTAEHNMSWPELVDVDAVKKKTWNPMTLGYGIDGIPHAFVIDKKGMLISADAGDHYSDLVEKALAEE